MFIGVYDLNQDKKYVNINRIKEFELVKVNQDNSQHLQLVFYTIDSKVYYINFQTDQELELYNLIYELCNFGKFNYNK